MNWIPSHARALATIARPGTRMPCNQDGRPSKATIVAATARLICLLQDAENPGATAVMLRAIALVAMPDKTTVCADTLRDIDLEVVTAIGVVVAVLDEVVVRVDVPENVTNDAANEITYRTPPFTPENNPEKAAAVADTEREIMRDVAAENAACAAEKLREVRRADVVLNGEVLADDGFMISRVLLADMVTVLAANDRI